MSSKRKRSSRAKKKTFAPRVAPLQRELAMPKYGYQSPATGSLVLRYDEVEERKKNAAPVPAMQNFNFAP